EIACPMCQRTVEVQSDDAGKYLTCLGCNHEFQLLRSFFLELTPSPVETSALETGIGKPSDPGARPRQPGELVVCVKDRHEAQRHLGTWRELFPEVSSVYQPRPGLSIRAVSSLLAGSAAGAVMGTLLGSLLMDAGVWLATWTTQRKLVIP